MKSAIITGANGLVGRSLVVELAENNVEILCLGRRSQQSRHGSPLASNILTYLQLDMSEIGTLADKSKTLGLSPSFFEDCVFFHLAWEGEAGLTDGGLTKQLSNAVYVTEAIKVAKRLGCKKFINLGTASESLIEYAFHNNLPPFDLKQFNYGIAKLAARDMAKITAYLQKLDYIHARVSVPLDENLNSEGYISATLKKIALRKPYDDPLSEQPYDLVLTSDLAKALRVIGSSGEDKNDYYIGSGCCTRLKALFDQFKRLVEQDLADLDNTNNERLALAFLFDTSLLENLGYSPSKIDYRLLIKNMDT